MNNIFNKRNVVYKIENNINHMIYIGITSQKLRKRWINHIRPPRKGRISYLQRAIQKYGEDNFTLSIVEELPSSELLEEREKYWISQYNCVSPNGYNLTYGGEIKKIYSEETKRKISLSSKNRSKESNLKIANARKGKPNLYLKNIPKTKEQREKISKTLKKYFENKNNHPFYGKHHSEETKEKIRKSRVEKHFASKSNVKVMCVETGQIFSTMTEAGKWCGINTVKECIYGRQKTAGGYHWIKL